MNDREAELLENLLREQPLRAPSQRLDERVQGLWSGPSPRRRRTWIALGSALAAVAAGLLVAVCLWPGGRQPEQVAGVGTSPQVGVRQPPSAPPAGLPAVQIERVWTSLAASGVVPASSATPAKQRVQEQSLRQVEWIDQQRGVRIEWTMANEATVLVPLEYN